MRYSNFVMARAYIIDNKNQLFAFKIRFYDMATKIEKVSRAYCGLLDF